MLDELDARLVGLLSAEPRVGVLEASRRLGVARGTVQAEVLEVHTITGAGDMLCRAVARTNADLQRVIDAIVDVSGVLRASTVIALDTALTGSGQPILDLPNSGTLKPELLVGEDGAKAIAQARAAALEARGS